MTTPFRVGFALILPVALAVSCAGAPERPAPSNGGEASTGRYAEADVAFMQGMIAHHAQALMMTDLVPSRSDSKMVRLLARRIDATQDAEIDLMRRWLEARGERVPAAAHEPRAGGYPAEMPGMLTDEEMDRLAEASGDSFDRLFLEFMISHHQGALTMVADLLASDDGGREPQIFRFSSAVDADQRAEIARMRNLLTEIE